MFNDGSVPDAKHAKRGVHASAQQRSQRCFVANAIRYLETEQQ